MFETAPGVENRGDRPRLCRAAARQVRRVAVEDLADLSEPGIAKMIADRAQKALRRAGVAMDAVVGERPRAEQPNAFPM